VVHIGFHFTPMFSFVKVVSREAKRSSSCCLVKYKSQPMSVAVSMSEAFGHKLKA